MGDVHELDKNFDNTPNAQNSQKKEQQGREFLEWVENVDVENDDIAILDRLTQISNILDNEENQKKFPVLRQKYNGVKQKVSKESSQILEDYFKEHNMNNGENNLDNSPVFNAEQPIGYYIANKWEALKEVEKNLADEPWTINRIVKSMKNVMNSGTLEQKQKLHATIQEVQGNIDAIYKQLKPIIEQNRDKIQNLENMIDQISGERKDIPLNNSLDELSEEELSEEELSGQLKQMAKRKPIKKAG